MMTTERVDCRGHNRHWPYYGQIVGSTWTVRTTDNSCDQFAGETNASEQRIHAEMWVVVVVIDWLMVILNSNNNNNRYWIQHTEQIHCRLQHGL